MPRDSKEVPKGRFQVEIDMKFAIKSIVAAAAFVAVGVASAASVSVVADGKTISNGFTVTGAGTLQFSKNLASALSLGQVTVGAFGTGATAVKSTGSITNPTTGKVTTYATYDIGAPISGLTYDNTTGKVQQVLSTGGTTQDMAQNDQITAGGGSAKVGNLDVRFQADGSVQIFGTITGSSTGFTTGTPNVVNFSGLLFNVTAANVSGVTTFTNAAGTYNTTLKGLALTTAGFNALADVFELDSAGLGYSSLQSATSDFGTLNSSIIVTKAVPEPSTYALMGVGLIGLSLVARRRAK
jgi:hypothetical protein